MPLYRCQVALRNATDLAVDNVVNTLYLQDGGVTTDPQNLATDLAELYATYRTYPQHITGVTVVLYDMASPLPRPAVAQSSQSIGGVNPDAPREVAVCLSFFSDRNIPRQRGRLYVGPWGQNAMALRPDAGLRGIVGALAGGLAGIGGLDVDWSVWSPTDGVARPVSDWWVDDEYDTIRSRGLEGTTRLTGTVNE